VVITTLVVLARLALDASWGREHNRHLVFLPTVMLSAWLGGLGPGLVSAALSTVALDYFWTSPPHLLFRLNLELTLFLLIATAICFLVQSLHNARARADDARRSHEQVLAVVAHDLRNPLSTVKMTSERIRQVSRNDETLRHRLRTIEHASSRMEHLIRDLVDSTRLEHDGQLVLDIQSEPFDAIVREALDLVAPVAEEQGVTLALALPPGELPVDCDRDRLMQVLGNLLGNALKYTPAGGRISVRVDAGVDDNAQAVQVTVEDTGPGIKPEHLSHVFERYWKTDPKGTGLGLFIASSVVRAHGGSMRALKKAAPGATFVFTLPRVHGAAVLPPVPRGLLERLREYRAARRDQPPD
jgi:signal transduction histidine kinase